MSSEYEYVQRLLRLKRYEQPQDGYYEQFLDDFRQRREAEEAGLVQTRPGLLDRITEWFQEMSSRRWVYATGAAYAAVMIGVFFSQALKSEDGDIIAERPIAPAEVIPVELSNDDGAAIGSKDTTAKTDSATATAKP